MKSQIRSRSICQGCGAQLTCTVVDLGWLPLANSYVATDAASTTDLTYPLHMRVCDHCWLVQVDTVVQPKDIFTDYAYFSSYSESWLEHCRYYAEEMVEKFKLDQRSQVVEIASNDGYLLQYFLAMGVAVMGIEPAANVAATAIARGVHTEIAFFGRSTAERMVASGWNADLLAANNVLAHVPDINDFISGVRVILKPEGVFTVEFPHVLQLLRGLQFDTIYHEHFTYLSLIAVKTIVERHGLRIIDVEKLTTHGGSLRLFISHCQSCHSVTSNVQAVLIEEVDARLDRLEGYEGFDVRVQNVRRGLIEFLREAKNKGELVIAYGAAAKGNTLLNYCGITIEDIKFVVDRNPAKQNRLLPGSRIPICPVEDLIAAKPDHVLILPWNIKEEIVRQLPEVVSNGGDFVIAIPDIRRVNSAF